MADGISISSPEAQTTFTRLDNSIDRMFNEFQVKFLADAKLLLEKAFGKSIDFPVANSQSCEESDDSSLVPDFVEPKDQVSTNEISAVMEFSDSQLEPPLAQGIVSTKLVETEKQPLLTWSVEGNVFDELFMRTKDESVGIEDSFGTLLDNDLAMGLLKQPQDMTSTFDSERCDDLMRGFLDSTTESVVEQCEVNVESREDNQLADRITLIDIRNYITSSLPHGQRGAGMVMICNDKFRLISSVLVESEDPYGFRLLLMGNKLLGMDKDSLRPMNEVIEVNDPCRFRLLVMGDNTECEKFTSHIYSFSVEQYQRELSSNEFWMQQVREVILVNDDNYGKNIERQRLQSDNKWLQDWRDFQGLAIVELLQRRELR